MNELVLASACLIAAAPAADEPSPEAAKVRAVLDAQVKAWNKGDLEGFMRGYWKSPLTIT